MATLESKKSINSESEHPELEDHHQQIPHQDHQAPSAALSETFVAYSEINNGSGILTSETTSEASSSLSSNKTELACMPTLEPAGNTPAGVHIGLFYTAPNTGGLTMHAPISEEERSSTTEMVGMHEQENSVQGMKSELAENQVTICKLKQDLESTTLAKEKAEQESLVTKQHCEEIRKEKNAEISKLKGQVENYEQRISKLEKNNEEDRTKYEAEIERLKSELESKEKEHEREIFKLERKIFCHEKKILEMTAQEEKLKRLLAEANLTIAEEEKVKMKVECDTAKKELYEVQEELDEAKVELERKASDVGALTEYLASMGSFSSTTSGPSSLGD